MNSNSKMPLPQSIIIIIIRNLPPNKPAYFCMHKLLLASIQLTVSPPTHMVRIKRVWISA